MLVDVVCFGLQLEDSSLCTYVEVYIVISADVIAAVEMDTSDVIFSCWCSSVIGWTNLFNSTDPTSTPSTGKGLPPPPVRNMFLFYQHFNFIYVIYVNLFCDIPTNSSL